MNTSEYLPFDPMVASKKRLPRGTVDCHFHVFEDPQTYPFTANRSYTPSLAPWAAFEKMNDTIGADRAVLVHPSVYGYDHRTLYDTMQAHPGRLRAVGVLAADTPEAEIERLHKAGTRGARVNILFAGELIALRMAALVELKPIFNNIYKDISDTKPAEIIYKSSIENPSINPNENSEKIMEKLTLNRGAEIERGLTLTGPHRDDLVLALGDHLVKGYASHGESWSIALSLKLATYNLLKSDGLSPILILDDVFSELDEDRREKLAQIAQSAEQTLITVAVENDLPKAIIGSRYLVKSGVVSKL